MPFVLTYTIEGDVGNEDATHSVYLPTSFSIAQYTTFSAGLATALNNLIQGKILQATLSLVVDVSALTDNVSYLGDIEEKGYFQFLDANGDTVDLSIPALNESLVVPTTHELDQTETAISDIVTAMTGGIAVTGGTIIPCGVAETDIVGLIVAEESFISSGKRRKQ